MCPIYEYECPQCGKILEEFRSLSERDTELLCDDCMKKLYRVVSRSSFLLKGDGWAKDGYSSKQ